MKGKSAKKQNEIKENENIDNKLKFTEFNNKIKSSSLENRNIKIGVCTLNNLSMDFDGNKERIIRSIKTCIEQECSIRVGPECEITGYSCEDYFLEADTINHNWKVIADIINLGLTDEILCDLSCLAEWNGSLYNSRIFIYKRKILLIRPKYNLCDDGNYYESRWFTSWRKGFNLYDYKLPQIIFEITGQINTKIGMGIIQFKDVGLASEICEEAWVGKCPSIDFCLAGADIIINNSASLFNPSKYKTRTDILKISSLKNGGCFVYSNLIGCDGSRIIFDGGSFITLNGKIIKESRQSTLIDVEVTCGIIDMDEIVNHRLNQRSRCSLSNESETIEKIIVDENLCKSRIIKNTNEEPIEGTFYPEEESYIKNICVWLFDYLRKSGASGFFLALSGGSDSGIVCSLVGHMCRIIYDEITQSCEMKKIDTYNDNKEFVLRELRKIVKDENYYPTNPTEICSKILYTAYLSTCHNSEDTRKSSREIANEMGSQHLEVEINNIYNEFLGCLNKSLNFTPKFLSNGGTYGEDLSLQNVQSRVRMVMSYLLAQVAPIKDNKKGFLIMLTSGNLDEAQLGYLTKYDCSSGDLNPIGSLSKVVLKKLIKYMIDKHNYSSLKILLKLTPSAELRPLDTSNPNNNQSDEADLGFTYEEINILNNLRLTKRFGPFSMFKHLTNLWNDKSESEIKDKLKRFFFKYSVNRHKVTVLTPSVFLNNNCNDDNRYDMRPFLYNCNWKFQFDQIDALIKNKESISLKEEPEVHIINKEIKKNPILAAVKDTIKGNKVISNSNLLANKKKNK